MNTFIKHIVLSTQLILMMSAVVSAQIKKDVYIMRDFQPVLSDVQKIDEIPQIDGKIELATTPQYSLIPPTVQSSFKVKSIKPAKMVGTPLDKLYKSYVKAGLGNYLNKMGEFSIHNLRSQEYAVGAIVRHESSNTNIKLDNNHGVPGGYRQNEIGVYGKKFYDGLNLEGELFYNTHGIRHYGYNTTFFTDTFPEMDRSEVRQNYREISGKARLLSTSIKEKALKYNITVDGKHFWDRFDNKISEVNLGGGIGGNIKDFDVSLDVEYKLVGAEISGEHNAENVLKLWPKLRKQTDEWQVELGAKFYQYNDEEAVTHFYPHAELQFHVVKGIFTPYFGIDGDFVYKNYAIAAKENPYIKPGLDVESTNMKLVGYGGIMGSMSKKLRYRLDISFASMEDVYFFINDSVGLLQNEFLAEHHDVDRVKYFAELNYEPLKNLSFWVKANMYDYTLLPSSQPWHKPKYDLTFTTRYNIREKIYLGLELYNIGERKAKEPLTWNELTLDPIVDLNLKIEYKYSKILSVFLDFYNITSVSYYEWNQYASQKLNILAGFTYKL